MHDSIEQNNHQPAYLDANDEGMFSHIALSLSGGGLRATGFHLGAMDILDRVDLLKNVHILSSLSGGSLMSTTYAMCAQDGAEGAYQRCFDNLYDFMPKLNTIEEIFRQLTAKQAAAPSGRRDLITGMANVLDEQYFSVYWKNSSFGAFWGESDSPLAEIIFNATEFKTGNAFRFQKSQLPCRIGNGNVWVEEEHAKKIRMGDVLAASACIPAGMEPLFFPQDFHWPDDDGESRPTCMAVADTISQCHNNNELAKSVTSAPYIALMDGGVYDTQGLTSILLTMLRRNIKRQAQQDGDDEHSDPDAGIPKEPTNARQWGSWMKKILGATHNLSDGDSTSDIDLSHLRLFIISDTPPRTESMYPKVGASIQQKKPGFFGRRTLGQYDGFLWVLSLLLLISSVENLYELVALPSSGLLPAWLEVLRNLTGFIIPSVICLLFAATLIGFRRLLARGQEQMEASLPKFDHKPWHYLKKVRLADMIQMIGLRISSTTALTAKVYGHRIRQLVYSTIFASAGKDSLSDRILTNEIHTLIDPVEPSTQRLLDLYPSEDFKQIITRAAQMKTALWLDPEETYQYQDSNGKTTTYQAMDILVSAGQITTCYNLMLHIRQRFGKTDSGQLEAGTVAARYDAQLMEVWEQLLENPFHLVESRKEKMNPRKPGLSS